MYQRMVRIGANPREARIREEAEERFGEWQLHHLDSGRFTRDVANLELIVAANHKQRYRQS